MPAKITTRDIDAELAYLTRTLKASTLREALPQLLERAPADGWSLAEFLAACLERAVTARAAYGGS